MSAVSTSVDSPNHRWNLCDWPYPRTQDTWTQKSDCGCDRLCTLSVLWPFEKQFAHPCSRTGGLVPSTDPASSKQYFNLSRASLYYLRPILPLASSVKTLGPSVASFWGPISTRKPGTSWEALCVMAHRKQPGGPAGVGTHWAPPGLRDLYQPKTSLSAGPSQNLNSPISRVHARGHHDCLIPKH